MATAQVSLNIRLGSSVASNMTELLAADTAMGAVTLGPTRFE